MREYERKLLLRETEELSRSLDQSTALSSSLGRMGELLRVLMRTLGGEDAHLVPASILAASSETETGTSTVDITTTVGHMAVGQHPQKRIINSLELEPPPSPVEPTSSFSTSSASTSSFHVSPYAHFHSSFRSLGNSLRTHWGKAEDGHDWDEIWSEVIWAGESPTRRTRKGRS